MKSFIIFVAIVACVNAFPAKDVPLFENGIAKLLGGINGGMVPVKEERIVGGQYAEITQVPWTGSLQFLGSHRCGCGIVSPTVVISAAHCASHMPGDGFTVRAGSASKSTGGQLVPTSQVFIHPAYNQATLANDICVIFLAAPLNTLVAGVGVIAMQSAGASLPGGTTTTVSGWGAQIENGPQSDILLYVSMPSIILGVCNEMLGVNLSHDMMCAGLDDGGVGTCDGDEGSPLVANNELVGVKSWGIGCARPGLPAVFSRIGPARTWIDFILNSNI